MIYTTLFLTTMMPVLLLNAEQESLMDHKDSLIRSTPSLQIEPIPQPEEGQDRFLGFNLSAPWMTGAIRVRFPEDINSSLGRHFLDQIHSGLPLVSDIEYPVWKADPETGGICYRVVTKEGLEFGGSAWVIDDRVEMAMTVRNGTGQPQNILAQVCLDLQTAEPFSEKDTLDTTFTWLDGGYRSLAEATPFREDKRQAFGARWVLVLMKGYAGEDLRSIENEMAWWIVEQTADHPVIVRSTPDSKHLVAVTWDHDVQRLMSNTLIPCLHADPLWATGVADGETVIWRGRLYLMKNDPEALLDKMKKDHTGPLRRGEEVSVLP